MSAKSDANPSDLASWQVEVLRLTAFPSPTAQIEPNWWSDLAGKPPDLKTTTKRGESQEEGEYENGKLILKTQPTRIDWYYAPSEQITQEGYQQGFVTMGSFPDIRDQFRELILRWLEKGPTLQRLAFGAILFRFVPDRDTSYRLLERYVPFTMDPQGSFDFIYQINRPRKLQRGLPSVAVNRLNRWQAMMFQGGPLDLQRGFSPTIEQHVIRLELDINTHPELTREISPGTAKEIFSELVDLATELAQNGDRP